MYAGQHPDKPRAAPHVCASGGVRVTAPGLARRTAARVATTTTAAAAATDVAKHSMTSSPSTTPLLLQQPPPPPRQSTTPPLPSPRAAVATPSERDVARSSSNSSSTTTTTTFAADVATASREAVAVGGDDAHMTCAGDGNGRAADDRDATRQRTSTTSLTHTTRAHGDDADMSRRLHGNAVAVAVAAPHSCDVATRMAALCAQYPLLRVLPLCVVHEQMYRMRDDGGDDDDSDSSSHNDNDDACCRDGDDGDDGNDVARVSSSSSRAATTPPPLLALQCSVTRQHIVDLAATYEERSSLRSLLWGGCAPALVRPAVWRLLCGHAPALVSAQQRDLQRKRDAYAQAAAQYYDDADHTQPTAHAHVVASSNRSHDDDDEHDEAADLWPPSPSLVTLASTSASTSTATTRLLARSALPAHERAIARQIRLDLPRHATAVFRCARTAASLARCLFLWAQRHPAAGYVQGMDDIVAVYYHVFLADALWQRCVRSRTTPRRAHTRHHAALATHGNDGNDDDGNKNAEHDTTTTVRRDRCRCCAMVDVFVQYAATHNDDDDTSSRTGDTGGVCVCSVSTLWQLSRGALEAAVATLPEQVLMHVEADTYGCAGAMLSQLQDNYTHGLPGTATQARRLEALLRRASECAELMTLLDARGVSVAALCFPWLHCLLARELPLPLVVRLWDSYLAMGGGDEWSLFHVYVCAALLRGVQRAVARASPDMAVAILHDPFVYAMATSPPPPPPLATLSSPLAPQATTARPQRRRQAPQQLPQPIATRNVMAATRASGRTAAGNVHDEEQRRQRVWLSMLIADAYRLWRLYPPHTIATMS